MTTTAKLDESASTLVVRSILFNSFWLCFQQFLQVGVAIVAYSICSSTLLLANKFVTLHISSTVVISLIQLIFTSLTLLIIKGLNIEKIDDFEWTKVKGYLILTIFFFASIFTNIKALAISNVETVIVFRSCSPIAICFIEYLFLERELPSLRSTLSLAGVACGAIFYCMQESSLQFQGWAGYTWVLIYFCTISLDMTYGKLLSQSVKMESVWGSVYYCNVLAILPFLCMGIYEGDLTDKLLEVQNLSWMVMSVLIFSCIVGTFIG